MWVKQLFFIPEEDDDDAAAAAEAAPPPGAPGPKEKEEGGAEEDGAAAAAAPKPKGTAAPADDPAPSAGFGSVKEVAGGGAESRAAMLDAGENGGAPVAAASALSKSGLGPAAREEPIAPVALVAWPPEAVPSLQRGCSVPAEREAVDPPRGGMPVKLKEEAVAEAVEAKLPASDVPAVVAAAAAAVGSGTDDSADLPVPKPPPPSKLGSSDGAVPAAPKAGSSSSSSSSVPERSCHFFIDDLHASSRGKRGGHACYRAKGEGSGCTDASRIQRYNIKGAVKQWA